MEKILVSPGMYLQGENILETCFEELLQYGKQGMFVTDTFVYQLNLFWHLAVDGQSI